MSNLISVWVDVSKEAKIYDPPLLCRVRDRYDLDWNSNKMLLAVVDHPERPYIAVLKDEYNRHPLSWAQCQILKKTRQPTWGDLQYGPTPCMVSNVEDSFHEETLVGIYPNRERQFLARDKNDNYKYYQFAYTLKD